MKPTRFLLPAVLSLALLGAGCDGSTSTDVGATPGGAGAGAGASGSAAAAIPSDIPQYPGATVTLANGAANIFIYAATTDDSAEQVKAWYDQQFGSAGFKSGASINLNASAKQYYKDSVSMTFSVIDKSQPQANGHTILKITRQVR